MTGCSFVQKKNKGRKQILGSNNIYWSWCIVEYHYHYHIIIFSIALVIIVATLSICELISFHKYVQSGRYNVDIMTKFIKEEKYNFHIPSWNITCPGPILLTYFQSQFKFDRDFLSLVGYDLALHVVRALLHGLSCSKFAAIPSLEIVGVLNKFSICFEVRWKPL